MDTSTSGTVAVATPRPCSAAIMNQTRDNNLFALAYGRRYGLRMIRFYTHIITLSTFVELAAASTAIACLMGNYPQWGLWSSATVAIAAITRRVLRPEEQRARCVILNDRYARVLALACSLSDDALHSAVQELQSADAPDLECLRNPVWNDVVQEQGYCQDRLCALTIKERLIGLMA